MTEPRGRGRPKKDPKEVNIQKVIGAPAATWEKARLRGGQAWIRKALKLSKVPPLPGYPKPDDEADKT